MNFLEETKKRWNEAAKRYSESINNELAAKERQGWTALIQRNAPREGPLEVLDIGTGPGFFAIILSHAGHKVTAIDCTPGMLEQAKINFQKEGVEPALRLMDSHKLDFADNTFDLIVNRNVTWILHEPEAAYREWKRVLKPGGRLLIFDANWYMNVYDEETGAAYRRKIREYYEQYGCLPERPIMHKIEDYWIRLPLVGVPRPQWDKAVLMRLGFIRIHLEHHIDKEVSSPSPVQDIYNLMPMFMISAAKGTHQQEQADLISRYWDGYAPEFAVSCIKGLASPKAASYTELLREELPVGKPLKVLDVGAGAGFMAFLLAREGHDVTGIDFSPIMLEEAEYIKKKTGIKVDFQLSPADLLPFEEETFDLIVSRNSTWLMQEPEKAFGEWKRVLKKAGTLLYFDGNWYNYLFYDDEWERFTQIRSQARERRYTTLYGMGHSSSVIMDDIAKELPLSKALRPQWDKDNLNALGLLVEHIIDDVSPRLCTEDERFVNAYIPLFMIKARKI
ncbi:MAG: methyltransferase domain-containing protein [Spirochaetaceae bacterium]|jgi:ubiquinone/menaquinone biosynthesis C-methylase UbiE|nr:methyltransferase domain-containing protein [Spirochaetaceae bacterium]